MEQRLTGAFILSLLAGLWMLGSGVMMYGMHYDQGSWMWHQGMMRGMGVGYGMGQGTVLWWPWFGFIAGVIVLVSAAMLFTRPAQARIWGMIILILSAVDALVGMGGLLAGTLGVIGGALALAAPAV
jgi:hypothetical protein